MKNGEIIEGLPFEKYLDLPALNNSGITELMRSPLHYWVRFLDPKRVRKEPTPALKLGSAIHTMILEPSKFAERYVVAPEIDRRTKDGKAAWAELEATGREILTAEQNERILAIAHVVAKHPAAQVLFSDDGKSEITVVGKDPETGVPCKIRIDRLTGLVALDLKSTEDASPVSFPRSIAKYGYHRQTAFYNDVFYWGTGEHLDAFIFAAYEKESPFACAHYEPDDELVEQGRREYRPMLRVYADCLTSGRWPGYPEEIQKISLPAWAIKRDEDYV